MARSVLSFGRRDLKSIWVNFSRFDAVLQYRYRFGARFSKEKKSLQADHSTIHAAIFDEYTGSQQFVPARAGLPRPLYL